MRSGTVKIEMLFFDTYALIEIIKGNPSYQRYAAERCITTQLNLMELYYALLRLADEKTAERYFQVFLPACVDTHDDTLKAAMRFLFLQRKNRNLISYVDCVGYMVALEKGVKVLTGERHFSSLENVEYVK